MSDPQLATLLTQFGVAGLIGWMWLAERRAGAAREKQLAESHDRLMQERAQLDALLTTVRENTRALGALEATQRRMASLLERLGHAAHPPFVPPLDGPRGAPDAAPRDPSTLSA